MKKNSSTRWGRFLCSIGKHLWSYSSRPDLKDPSEEFVDGQHYYRFCRRCGEKEHLLLYGKGL